MQIRPFILAGVLAFAAVTAPAAAQTPPDRGRSEAWYGEQLIQLANVLGGVHYLRILCNGRTDQRWRDYMLGVNAREPQYRNRLIEAFNGGYRDEEARYETCDRSATQAEAELRAQGLRIADALRARHAE